MAGLALQAASPANAQEQPGNIADAIAKGTPIVELRPRYEQVEQAGRPNDAEAATRRTRLSWQTATRAVWAEDRRKTRRNRPPMDSSGRRTPS